MKIDCSRCEGEGYLPDYTLYEYQQEGCVDCPDCKTTGKITVYTEEEHFQALLKEKLVYQDDYAMKVGTVNPSQVVGKVYTEAEVQEIRKAERERCAVEVEHILFMYNHNQIALAGAEGALEDSIIAIRNMEDK